MPSDYTFKAAAVGLAMLMGLGMAGEAAAQTLTCRVTGSSTAQPSIYDPFNTNTGLTTDITMLVERYNGAGGGDTRVVNMYLRGPTTADGTTVVPLSVVPYGNGNISSEGINLDIYYDSTENSPIVLPSTTSPTTANKFLKINFTGNNADSDKAVVKFRVTLPANLDLQASTQLAFDGYYGCLVQGGQGNGTEVSSSFPNAMTFPITVLSALQASFVGTALDFGEIGDIDNAAAPSKNTGLNSNYVRVQSSGAYTVSLQSANAYRLLHPSGSLSNSLDTVKYKLSFLGRQLDFASNPAPGGTAFTQNCARAGVKASEADLLYLSAALEEGGQGKNPSLGGQYRDTLTVTITPQDIGVTYPTPCPNL